MEARKSTCQVCGRAIKLVLMRQCRGGVPFGVMQHVIAHHGYQRPGDGWQTASCMGARRLPYEVAHDALDEAIVACNGFIETTKKNLARWLKSPPDTLTQPPRDIYDRSERKPQPQPEGFNPRACLEAAFATNGSYDQLYRYRHHAMKRDLEMARWQLNELRQRRADWKEPAR
jgi:hypothetical protein